MTWDSYIDSFNNDLTIYPIDVDRDWNEFKQAVYRNTYKRLYLISLNVFKWTCKEKTISTRAIELGFMNYGQCCGWYDNDLNGVFVLGCLSNGMVNIYGDPIEVSVSGANGFHKIIPLDDNAVLCRDNDLSYPYKYFVWEYATKIADKKIALDIATQRLKSPFMYEVDSAELKGSVDKMVKMIEQNEDVIVQVKSNKLNGDKEIIKAKNISISPETITAIKNSISYDFNEFLENLGINTNPSPDKSQVVLTPEINSNNSVINIETDLRFDLRREFCDELKSRFGIDISVERRSAKEVLNEQFNETAPQTNVDD